MQVAQGLLSSGKTTLSQRSRSVYSKRWFKQGRITGNGASGPHSEIVRLLASASEHDLKTANDRFDLVHHHLHQGVSAREMRVPERTLRLWTARYRRAKEEHGSGYVGRLPRTSCRGNRTQRLPDDTRKLLREFMERDYETLKQRSSSPLGPC